MTLDELIAVLMKIRADRKVGTLDVRSAKGSEIVLVESIGSEVILHLERP